MSAYIEKIEKHAVHSHLQSVQAEILAIQDMKNKPPADVDAFARIVQVIKNFSQALDSCDKNLISISWLDEASKALSNICSYLASYKSNKDPNYLISHSFGQLDALLNASVKLNCIKSRQSMRNYIECVNEHTRVMSSQQKQLYQTVQGLNKDVEAIRTEIEAHRNTTSKNSQEFKDSIDKERVRLDSFATSYQNQMAADQKEFAGMLDSLKSTFSATQEERKKAFDATIEGIKEQKDAIKTDAEMAKDDFSQNGNTLIKEYDEKFEAFEKQVENIVGIVNTNMFSHRYKQVADNARTRARIWHIITVILIIAVGGFAVYAFMLTLNEDTSWVKLVAKIFATSTLVTGAAYAARQASKQEKVERYTRKVELELVAIDPFIESLDDDKKSLLKQELARKIFGDANALEINSSDESYTALDKLTSIEGLLKTIAPAFEKMSK